MTSALSTESGAVKSAPATRTLPDLEAIKEKWLKICGACDAGIGECNRPAEDHRPVMLELVRAIERLDKRDRTLADVHREMIAHFTENPTHGYNCICMDRLIGEVRQQLLHVGRTDGNVSTPQTKARHALRYALLVVSRQL